MGTFFSYFFLLFIASLIFPFIYSFLAIPLMGAVVLIGKLLEPKGDEPPSSASKAVAYTAMGPLFLAMAYILCGWSAYVATITNIATARPSVHYDWIYFVAGFFLCNGPLGYMASKEEPGNKSGSCAHISIAMVAYIVFCIWPQSPFYPYGWFLRFLT